MADEAVCIGDAPSSASYLYIPSILTAALSRGAEAIHPVMKHWMTIETAIRV